MVLRVSLFLVAAIGCGGSYPQTAGPVPPQAMKGPAATAPAGGIAKAALPYQILDGRNGRQLDEAAVWPRLAKARAVCIGEEHPNPHHHWVQLHAVGQIAKQLAPGDKLALGMEMLQKPFQGVVDDYVGKRIDAAAFQSRVGWQERWGYDYGFYGPTIDAAVAAGGQVLALNVAQELRKKISKQGLAALTPEEKAQVPELKLDDAQHRAWWDALMASMADAHGAHGSPHGKPADGHAGPKMPSMEDIYRIQVLWDETMADTGAKWLAANPTGHLIIVAGNGHCHDSAIINRMKRRGIADVVSVRPVIDTDGQVSEVLAKPMNDFVVVLQMPKKAMRTSLVLPLPHASQRRDAFWEQVMSEVQRNPALELSGRPPDARGADLVIDGRIVRLPDDIRVAVVEAGTATDRRRAQFVVDQIAVRRAELLAIGQAIVTGVSIAEVPLHPHRRIRYAENVQLIRDGVPVSLASLVFIQT